MAGQDAKPEYIALLFSRRLDGWVGDYLPNETIDIGACVMLEDTDNDCSELELPIVTQAQEMGRDLNAIIRKMRALEPQLIAAYLTTDYVAHIDGEEIVINVGRPVPALLTERVRDKAMPGWAVITAYNPCSVLESAVSNEARQLLLAEMLSLHGYETHSALGRGADGEWEEPSILVLGISYELAGAIGASFLQNAVVFGEMGAAAELVFCEKDEFLWPCGSDRE